MSAAPALTDGSRERTPQQEAERGRLPRECASKEEAARQQATSNMQQAGKLLFTAMRKPEKDKDTFTFQIHLII